MGRDVNAHVAFGVDCGVEESPWLSEDVAEDVDDLGNLIKELCRQAGVEDPYDKYSEEIESMSYDDYKVWKANHPTFSQEVEAYKEASKKIEEACPVDIDWYGSEEVRSYVLYAKGTLIQGGWEGTKALDLDQMKALTPYSDDIARFCADHGLKWDNPTWLLYGSLF